MPQDPWMVGAIIAVGAWIINRAYEKIIDQSKQKAIAQEDINKEMLNSLKIVQISLERLSLKLDHTEETLAEYKKKVEEHDKDIFFIKNNRSDK